MRDRVVDQLYGVAVTVNSPTAYIGTLTQLLGVSFVAFIRDMGGSFELQTATCSQEASNLRTTQTSTLIVRDDPLVHVRPSNNGTDTDVKHLSVAKSASLRQSIVAERHLFPGKFDEVVIAEDHIGTDRMRDQRRASPAIIIAHRWPHRFTHKQISAIRDLLPHVFRLIRLDSEAQTRPIRHVCGVKRVSFTDKEQAVIDKLLVGQSYPEICGALEIKRNTLKWHMKNIFSKAEVNSLPALITRLSVPSGVTPPRGGVVSEQPVD